MDISKQKDQVVIWNHALQESARKLEGFRDRYYGKRCFIIGNGPSLNQIDWSLLKNEYTFGLNKIYLLFNKMGFTPSFYTCTNPLVIEQSIDEIHKITSEKFLPSNHIQLIEDPTNITFFKTSTKQYFSKDAAKEVSEGYTVTHAALQMAYFMGFRQVILVGVDHYFETSGLPNSIVVSKGDDPNHFDPSYFGTGLRWQLPDLQKSEISYNLSKAVFESDGRIILDGTINGRLTVFPKIDYRKIFETQQKITKCAEIKPKSKIALKHESPKNIAKTPQYKISVIVPTYNSETHLINCLNDLENQTISIELEIIVVNIDPEQNEEAIIQEFQKKYSNIQYIRTDTRKTKYQAWNHGIQMANGHYITCSNFGNRYKPNTLEKLAETLDSHPNHIPIYVNQYSPDNMSKGSPFFTTNHSIEISKLILYNDYIAGSCLWHNKIHEEFGYFDEAFLTAGDYEFWLRISQKYSFYSLNDALGELFICDTNLLEEDLNNLYFEASTISKCYKYADLYNIEINTSGLSNHPIFSDWCEFNILKRNVKTQLTGCTLNEIDSIFDWRKPQNTPNLSIIIVTYNRKDDLLLSLQALNLQSEKNFEVVVVNNGTYIDAFRSLPSGLLYDLCIVQMKANYGPSLARNIGAEYSKSNIIAILDDDAKAEHDWVSRILFHFQDEEIIGLRGRVLPKENEEYMHIPFIYDPGDRSIVNDAGLEMGAVYRKKEFLSVGGYNELLYHHEGTELSYRISKANNNRLDSIKYFPDIVIYHNTHANHEHLTEKIIRNTENKKMILKTQPNFDAYHSFFWRIYEQDTNNYNWCKYLMEFCYIDNPRMAIEFATLSINIAPLAIQPYEILGGSYFKLDEIHKSIKAFETVLELARCKIFDNNNLKTNLNDNLEKKYITIALKLAYLYLKVNDKKKFNLIKKQLEEVSKTTPFGDETNVKWKKILLLGKNAY
jgi:GT2 family glycosyltransferase